MPKMKTNSSAKKRFSFTGTGGIKRKQAFKNHILTKKTHKQKKRLTGFTMVHESDLGRVKRMFCMGK
jgi:large subunit ribosomal protein L35